MAVFRGFSVVLLGWAWATNAAAQSPRLLAEALGPDERVAVDGVLDEPVWARAQRTGGFVERRPVRGATPPVDTRFSVAYDEGALYFALICETDRPPRAFELTRDTFRIFDDDAISIKLDVRHDRRNTVGFVVNANGAQLDYVAVDNGRSFRREFDAVWEAETAVHEGEFIVEMRIPVPALGLAPAPGGRILGLEISRDHNARRATYDWAPIPVEFGAFSALHYGELEVPGALTGGRQFTLIPYVLGGLRED
ncbi:MAG: carbohydrate binding family 9 domain-containing protein, partial [Myxococcota bacterium]